MNKNKIACILGIIVVFFGAFFLGLSIGHDVENSRSIEEVKYRLFKMEQAEISKFVSIEATNKVVDKGGFFSVKWDRTITLYLTNSATLAAVKEIIVLITYIAKDGTERDKEIVINKHIAPRKTIEWTIKANEIKSETTYKYKIVKVSF